MFKNKKNIIYIILVLIVVFGPMYGTYYFLGNKDYNERGTFGDMFGSINAFYSGMAFAGIIITIIFQRQEMKLHSEEIKIQRFEMTLFNLLGLHQQITKDLFSNTQNNIHVNGRNTFLSLFELYEKDLSNDISEVFEKRVNDELGHYFRNIYRIIKFIDRSAFSKEVNYQRRYEQVKFLRSQLSSYELVWICYWGMTENGKELSHYIVKYTLLKNLPKRFKEKSEISKYYKDVAKDYNKLKEYKNQLEFSEDQAFEVNKDLVPK